MGAEDDKATDVDSVGPTRTLEGAEPARLLARGAEVGRFVILERLGGGATGTVYSAFDPTLDRQVALKLLHVGAGPGSRSSSMPRMRVEREARAMARIRHPNVVTIYEVGFSDDTGVFLAMEKVDGGTLGTWLRTKRSVREVLRVFGEAGEGLAAAHRSGLVHRDFKLDNVLMGTDGHPRVTDFGLARAVGKATEIPAGEGTGFDEPAPSSFDSLSEPLTRSGAILGTPGYMPPEQYGMEAIDERADIFAFCAALYRGLYAERPFVGDTVAELAYSTLHGQIRAAPKDSDVPVWLRRVVLRGLATKKEDRPASMDALLAMLRDDPARRWRRAAAIAAGIALVVGGTWTVHAASARRARACEASAAPLERVWSPAREAQIAAAFKAVGTSYSASAWAQVERVLDAYTSEWAAASEAACVATRVRGEQSEQMLELRLGCLEDRLAEVSALADVLSTADANVVKTSPKAVRALTPLDECSNIDRLSAAVRLPADPAVRAEIRALQDALAKAKVLYEAGRKLPSADLVASIRPRVERMDWGPLQVQWHARLASTEKRSDEKAAVADWEKAIALADQYRLDERKAAAEINLGSFEGSWLGRTEDAHMWMRMADASIARLGGSARLEVERCEEEAWIYQYEHKLAQAGPLFRQVLVRAQEAGIDDPDLIASANSGLSEALMAEGKWDEAEERELVALKTMEDTYGRDHPWITGYLNNLAVTHLAAGNTDAALATATRARDALEVEVERGDVDSKAPDYGIALHTLGEVQIRARKYEEAMTNLSHARAVYRSAHGDDNADVAFADNELAAAYRALRRPDDAKAMLDEATLIEQHVQETPPAVRAATLWGKAQLALDRGDAKRAEELAGKAVGLVREGDTTDWDLAEARLTLAKALRLQHRDPERAAKLAAYARNVFDRLHADAERDDARNVAGVVAEVVGEAR